MAVPRSRIHLVPPAEPHEPASRDVLEVVEVGREEEHGDDEDEDEARGEEPEAEEVDQKGRCGRSLSVRRLLSPLTAGVGGSWGWGAGGNFTHAESEEEEQRYGVGAQAPVQVALLRLLGSVLHDGGRLDERVTSRKCWVP